LETKAVLIICHGFCGSAEGGSSLELAETLLARGICVLRFRFTPQRPLSQQIAEIRSVADFCRRQLTRKVALLGRSMGAAAGLVFAEQDRSLAGLCLMAAPASLELTFCRILGETYTLLEQGESATVFHDGEPVHLTPEFIQDFAGYDLLRSARNISGTPLLLIHGLEDDTVPVEQGRQLFGAAGHPKKLLLLPGVSHSFFGLAPRFVPNVAEWLITEVFPDSAVV
jgi:putative redox protein